MKKLKALILAGVLGIPGMVPAQDGKGAVTPERADMPPGDRLPGYWAPDWEAMSAEWMPAIKEWAKLGGPGLSGAQLADAEKRLAEEMKEWCRVKTMEFTKDRFLQHIGPGKTEQEYRYVLGKVDAKAGTIEVEMTPVGGDPERGRILIQGDRLTIHLADDGANGVSVPWILDRIDRQAFEKRQKEAARSKRFQNAGKVPVEPQAPENRKPAAGHPEPRDPKD